MPLSQKTEHSRQKAPVSMLLALLSLGPACGEALPGEPFEESLRLSPGVAALADSNLYDSFTRANSATTLGSLETGGQSWSYTPSTATWGVTSGKAYLATDDGTWNDHYATVQGSANGRVLVTLSTLGQYSGLTFRFTDRNNCWKLATDTSAGKYFLTKFVGGTQTFPLQIAQAPAAGDVLEVRTSGTRIDVYINGVLKGGVNDASHQTAARAGLLGSQDNLARYDEFKVYTSGTRDATLQPFVSSSVWNLPIGTGATYADTTDAATKDFIATHINGLAITTWANWDVYSHPISFASTTDPWATVTDTNDSSRSGSYYVPAAAPIASGSDKHMHVIQPSRAFINEAWSVTRQSSTAYRAGRHHRIDLFGAGIGPQNGVRAYGGSAIGGLIRGWETTPTHPQYTGKIQHALAVAVDRVQLYYCCGTSGYDANGYGTAKGYVWPATEQDWGSETTYKGHVAMGAYFAIPPSVDLSTLGLTAEGRMVAQALQDFGAYVTDATGGTVAFYVEPTAPSSFVSNLRRDLPLIRSKMRRVTNNSASAPNGPGTRRVPLLPDLAPAP
ncbi:hypothetical protein POL68_23480 [Stigmatella sp. ncwal1]|uniref:Concanavalin A-like lectin/glucanases superfamily protein n=1 Tax=Stigmatella ashevillensis TaxID=2995309 RepID=A0ABT5DF78_9BACT|nr:hypothetical protein [Stigmatella ashevillena]MDC0711453.1 hypothetical protein [Stigmatella ashevillena]